LGGGKEKKIATTKKSQERRVNEEKNMPCRKIKAMKAMEKKTADNN
jgi:hypothetical protein